MNWRAKLQEQRGAIFEKGPVDSLTKLTKPSSVSFVSDPSGHFANIEAAALRNVAALKAERARLLALADAEWIDAVYVHRLHDADLAVCVALGLDDGQRKTFLHQLGDTSERHAGRVPKGDTAPIYCHHCGPVCSYPDLAAVLPLVGGWPRAVGCPWCLLRKAGGFIPRPRVACIECQHFAPDAINPAEGMGTCTSGHGTHWAGERHTCAVFSISTKKGDLA